MLQTHRPSNSNICCREMQDVFACTYAYTCASIFIRVWTVLVFWHILQAILEWILFVNKRTPLLALAFSQFTFKDRMAAMEKHSQAFFKACWFWGTELGHGHQQSATSTPASKAWCGRGGMVHTTSATCLLPLPTPMPHRISSWKTVALPELPKHVLHG